MSTSSRVGDHVVTLSAGEVVGGRYQTEELIGQGGMGAVYRAHDLRTGRAVAIKVLYAEYAAESGWRRRFVREARAAAAIRHPNIVDVLDVDVDGPVPFLAMELLAGETLGQLLARARTLTLAQAAQMIVPICGAIHAGHLAGIVHRDLKPENVLLCPRDGGLTPYVLDFGIAKVTQSGPAAETSGALTQTGAVLGTPHFMSPEQMLNEEEVDARADVWAIGVLLFVMLSGERPYAGLNLAQILKSVLTSTHSRLDELVPDLPADVVELVHACLAVKKEARPSGVDRIAEVLAPHTRGSATFRVRDEVASSEAARALTPRTELEYGATAAVTPLTPPAKPTRITGLSTRSLSARGRTDAPPLREPSSHDALTGPRRSSSIDSLRVTSSSKSTTRLSRIVFGMVPQRDDDKTRILLSDLCGYLTKQLDIPVAPHRSPSQDALGSALHAGRVHFAWTGALQVLLSEHLTQVTPVVSAVREGVAWYHSVLFAPASSSVHELADAAGKRVAWVATTSASGYVVPRLSLKRRGIPVDDFFAEEHFAGSHAAVTRALVSGRVDLAGTYAIFEDGDPTRPLVKSGFRTFDPELRVRVLDVSGPIPSDLIVASERVGNTLKGAISQAFRNIAADPSSREIMTDLIGADSFMPVTSSVLREVRTLVEVAGASGALGGRSG